MQSCHGPQHTGSPHTFSLLFTHPVKFLDFSARSIYGPIHHTASLIILPCYANLPECIFPYTSFCASHHFWTTLKIKSERSSGMSVNILETGTSAHPGKSVNILATETVTNPGMSVYIQGDTKKRELLKCVVAATYSWQHCGTGTLSYRQPRHFSNHGSVERSTAYFRHKNVLQKQ